MQVLSFYYRDSLDLSSLFPQAFKFSLLYPDVDNNVVIEEGIMRLKDPEALNPACLFNIVRVYNNPYDYFKIKVGIRCWSEGEYYLKEVTRLGALKTNRFYKLICQVVNKIHPLPYNTHLYSANGVSYFCNNNRLIIRDKSIKIIGKMPRLVDPIYYQFLPFGNEAFLRTGGHIYMSNHNMTKWKKIYEGKRAIKESMIWIEKENALLFSEYTPGLELSRHHLYKYFIKTGKLETVMTFYSPDEHNREGLVPYCRHIHVIMQDPFTQDIYVGVGDGDDESAIYCSKDNGSSFFLLGGGSQKWRTLSFFFTSECVFWNTDSPDPQYISCLFRENDSDITKHLIHYPLYNSASWNSVYDAQNDMYIMSASCEGMLFDNKNRIYGVRFHKKTPYVYGLFDDSSKKGEPIYRGHQLFVLGKDNQNIFWFYDTRKKYYRKFIIMNR